MSEIIVEKVVSRDEVDGLISYIKSRNSEIGQEEFNFENDAILKYLKKDSYPYKKIAKAIKNNEGSVIALHISLIDTTNFDKDYKPGDRLDEIIGSRYKLSIGQDKVKEYNDWPGRLSGKDPHLFGIGSNTRKQILNRFNLVLGLIVTPYDFDALAHELLHFVNYLMDLKESDFTSHKVASPFYYKLAEKDSEITANDPENYCLDSIVKSIGLPLDNISYYFRENEYETWLNDILNKIFVQSYEKRFKNEMKPLEYAKKAVAYIKPDKTYPNIKNDEAKAYVDKLKSNDSFFILVNGARSELLVLALWELTGYKTTNIKNHIFGIFQKKYGHKDNLIERYADEVKRKGTNLK